MQRFRLTAIAALVGLGLVQPVSAATVEERLERLERMQDNKAQVEMLMRLDSLQQELQQLRGLVEEQAYTIEGLRERQRELYLDIDRRLSNLERTGVSATAPAAGSAALTTGDGNQAAAPATGEVDAAAEREAYQQAFDLLRELRYEQAIVAFRDFITNYPNGRYSHIAQYWLGEANYAQRNFKQAITDYQALLSGYPDSPKRAEAMLKIGYSYNEMGNKDEAKKVLDELVQAYPDSTEAGQARSLLKRLAK